MRQLHACNAALLMNKTHDPGERLDVIVSPDPKVLRTDAAFREHSRRLGKHQTSAAYRAAAQVHEMPVIGISVGARVLAHRRNEDSIQELKIANDERIKQVSHSFFLFLWVIDERQARSVRPLVNRLETSDRRQGLDVEIATLQRNLNRSRSVQLPGMLRDARDGLNLWEHFCQYKWRCEGRFSQGNGKLGQALFQDW
jgi:hypothetical protein